MKASWSNRPLAEVSEVFADGDWVESKDQSEEGIRLIQTGNVGQGQFKSRDEKARYVSESTFNRLRCTEIFKGDCLISRLPDPVGRSCILPINGERMITAVDCTIVRFKSDLINPKFFVYYSQSENYLSDVETETTGTTRKRISRANLGRVHIPVPPLPEQQRIVAILDKAFAAIATAKANTEKNLLNARAAFQTLLQTVFSRREQVGWIESTIGQTCTIRSGTTLPPAIEKESGEIPYLKVADMNLRANLNGVSVSSRYVNRADINPNNLLPPGTTIFPKRGGAILTNKKRLTKRPICADLNIMGVTPKGALKPEILFNFFLQLDLCEINNGSSIPQINNYSVEPIRIAFPQSLREQAELAAKFNSLSTETQRLESIYEQLLGCLEELKRSLLDRAFAGAL